MKKENNVKCGCSKENVIRDVVNVTQKVPQEIHVILDGYFAVTRWGFTFDALRTKATYI